MKKDSNGESYIEINWYASDILDVDDSLSQDECEEVLSLCESRHDANEGINFGIIEHWIKKVKEEKIEKFMKENMVEFTPIELKEYRNNINRLQEKNNRDLTASEFKSLAKEIVEIRSKNKEGWINEF